MAAGANEPDRPDDLVGGYRLERRLGGGSMGQVWLGRHERTASVAAVKVLRRRPRGTDQLQRFFAREGRAIARLAHPHIVQLFDVGDDYLVTKHVAGSDLRRLLRTPIDPARAVRIALQVASALEHAHAQGVVHRDVKPSNILLDGDGNAYLADFGLAAITGDPDPSIAKARVGTPGYTAPEQLARGLSGPAADQYALARTLLVMLTGGELPEDRERALDQLPQDLPGAMREVLARAVDPVPEQRWPSVRAFADALADIDVSAYPAPVRVAPEVRVRTPFAWAERAGSVERFAVDLMRADYRLSDLEAAGVLDSEACAAFRERTGYADFGWAMFASDGRLGRVDHPSALARASEVVVLMHGLLSSRDVWRWAAMQLCRRYAQIVVLAPDLCGFGESLFTADPPAPEHVEAGAPTRAVVAWLELLGLREVPTVLVGHSMAAVSLLGIADAELGPHTARVAVNPVFPHIDRPYARQLRNASRMLRSVARPLFVRRLGAKLFVDMTRAARPYTKAERALFRECFLQVRPRTLAALCDAYADARPVTGDDLKRCALAMTEGDPLVPEEVARAALAELGLSSSHVHLFRAGGHFPHFELIDHPEWTQRNIDEMVAMIDGMLTSSTEGSMLSTQIASTIAGGSDTGEP